MKRTEKCLLALMSLAFPACLAACYGASSIIIKKGRVLDKDTRTGIASILVSCREDLGQPDAGNASAADGGVVEEPGDGGTPMPYTPESRQAKTDQNGNFTIEYDFPSCTALVAQDVDGTDNGTYLTATVDNCNDCNDFEIEMQKDPAAAQ